jgi:exopolysaccharide biosynthesis predicted pyruvyltransferase EpsI
MRISVLYTPGIWNIGNEFINQGAKVLIRNVFGGGEHKINNIELLETSSLLFNYRTDWATPYDKNIIKNSDLLIVVGGSCLNRYMKHIFDDIAKLGVPRILLGASFYEDHLKETKLYRTLHAKFDYIFTRDAVSYNGISDNKKNENVINGIDLAFWMQEVLPKVIQPQYLPEEKYVVVNIDSPENAKMQSDLIKAKKEKGFETVYISRNNPRMVGICNNDLGKEHPVFVAEKWYEYIRFYGSAQEVSTNRVHTFLVCLLLGVPVQFCHDVVKEGGFARHLLFEKLGIKLDSTKIYTSEDYKEFAGRLYEMKKNTENKLKIMVSYLKT